MHSSSPGPIASSIVKVTLVVPGVLLLALSQLSPVSGLSSEQPLKCSVGPLLLVPHVFPHQTRVQLFLPVSTGCIIDGGSYRGAGTPSCLHSSLSLVSANS